MKTKAAYVRAPFHVEIKDVPLPRLEDGQVLIQVDACGICGTDLHLASARAEELQPFGHEVAGRVLEVGPGVTTLKPGDPVCLESGIYCGVCADCRNGRVDLCKSGRNSWTPQGFAQHMVVTAKGAVPAEGLPPEAACLAEPLGVAQDLIVTSGLQWNDDVLLVGPGPIGLMTLALAKYAGARRVVVAGRSKDTARARVAKEWGADEFIDVREVPLADFGGTVGTFDRVLVTAPPTLIGDVLTACKYGATISYIGIDAEPGATISIDADDFHFRKLQLRASHASPALFLPRSLDLMRRGIVKWEELVTQQVGLEDLGAALKSAATEREHTIKVVVRP